MSGANFRHMLLKLLTVNSKKESGEFIKFKKFKKVIAVVLTAACVLGFTGSAAFAANVGDTVTADAYVNFQANWILNIDAHLTDTSVPPTNTPSNNAVLETSTSGYPYQVTIEFVNNVFAVESISMDPVVGPQNGTAEILAVDTTADSYRDGEERINKVTVGFTNLGEEYSFTAKEYANAHTFVKLNNKVGPKDMPITIIVTE